jgi:hypothetical protein
MNTRALARKSGVAAIGAAAKPFLLLTLLGILVSCSPEGYVYQSSGKETVPPPAPEVAVEDEPSGEYVELIESEHIHGPGCGHYFYDGEWHEAMAPEEAVEMVAEATDAAPEITGGEFEIHPPLSTAPGYTTVEDVYESPSVVVNVYEPDYYPDEAVVEERYYYYPTTAVHYYYDDYYTYDPWDYWTFSIGYGWMSGNDYWGISFGYRPYRRWHYYCWDPWWYNRWWWGYTYWYHPWRYWDYHYHHHDNYCCYDNDDHHHDNDHHYHDNDDHHRDRDDFVRDDRYRGPARTGRPVIDAEKSRDLGGRTLTTAERTDSRPVVPLSAVRSVGAVRPSREKIATTDRSSTRPERSLSGTRGPVLLDTSTSRDDPGDSPGRDAGQRPVIDVSERTRPSDTARLPAGSRSPSVDRLTAPERDSSEAPLIRSPIPSNNYSYQLNPRTGERDDARTGTRSTIGRTESRGVIVIPQPSSDASQNSRIVVVPPQSRQPVTSSRVYDRPTIISRVESSPSISARSQPSELSPARSSAPSSPPRSFERSEPSEIVPPSRPVVTLPSRVEAPSRPEPRTVAPPRAEAPSRPEPRTVAPPRVQAPSRPEPRTAAPPRVERPSSPPPRVEPPRSSPPRNVSPSGPSISSPPRPSAPSSPSMSAPSRPSRPSVGGMRRR